jgi:hypothetical protein
MGLDDDIGDGPAATRDGKLLARRLEAVHRGNTIPAGSQSPRSMRTVRALLGISISRPATAAPFDRTRHDP